MTYKETIDYLFQATPVFENVGASAYKEGLTNTLALDDHFKHPHEQYKTIHVAGTNGKGSCSHTLSSILQAEGYKVGLYTSPHLIDFRERIRVNGRCIDQERVIRFVEQERSFFESLHPSFFELTTALAFKYFAEQKVDIAVIEVGLGGRLDCTNIITPILSIITNISLDHTQFLGNTLPLIAKEKAGIIKEHIPVVVGETTTETKTVFEEVAERRDAPIIFAEDSNEIITSMYDNASQERVYDTQSFGEIHGDLMGNYQDKNANTVLNAVKVLKDYELVKLSDNSIRQGFKQVSTTTGLMGRWQCIQKSPATYCDTGHNVGGWTYLSQQLAQQDCEQMRIVFGMVNDKDLSTVMKMLPRNARYYWTQPSCRRAFPVEKVTQIGCENHLKGESFHMVSDAYQAAMHDAGMRDFIFIGGSSYVVADLLTFLK